MKEPYYEQDGITIYHGDAREVLVGLEFDVLVTDPPYGTESINGNERGGYGRRQNHDKGAGTGFTIKGDDGVAVRDEILAMTEGLPACVFGSPRMADPPIPVADRLVWNKTRPGMNGGPWRYMHETIYVTGGFVRVNNASVSVITEFPAASEHLHAKPLSLMLRLVAAAPLGVILDPFAGSGTTLVAAKHLRRSAIGIEIEERYCEIAAKRLAQGVLPFEDSEVPA